MSGYVKLHHSRSMDLHGKLPDCTVSISCYNMLNGSARFVQRGPRASLLAQPSNNQCRTEFRTTNRRLRLGWNCCSGGDWLDNVMFGLLLHGYDQCSLYEEGHRPCPFVECLPRRSCDLLCLGQSAPEQEERGVAAPDETRT